MMVMRTKMQVWIITIFEQCRILIVLERTLTLLDSPVRHANNREHVIVTKFHLAIKKQIKQKLKDI